MRKKDLGLIGEQKAAEYFKKHGFKILERNFFLQHGEIDLIVGKDQHLVFVEVKTRISGQFGLPEESITGKKTKALIRSVNYYISRGNFDNFSWQIDLIAINIDKQGKVERFQHFENIIT